MCEVGQSLNRAGCVKPNYKFDRDSSSCKLITLKCIADKMGLIPHL